MFDRFYAQRFSTQTSQCCFSTNQVVILKIQTCQMISDLIRISHVKQLSYLVKINPHRASLINKLYFNIQCMWLLQYQSNVWTHLHTQDFYNTGYVKTMKKGGKNIK